MDIFQGVFLGILQGLTEFLPVSSSGHLVLGQIFFGMTEAQLVFDISVHMGTLLAVFVVYASDIRAMLVSVSNGTLAAMTGKSVKTLFREDENLRMAVLIVIGSVPTALIGLLIKEYEQILFASQVLVGCMLILTGTILWASRRYYTREKENRAFGVRQGLFIGITQGLAVIPGISRSGSTIAAGMFMGLGRETAARFSFLLSIPAIVGAEILGLKDAAEAGLGVDPVIIYATIASFITGLFALKILLRLVHSGRFHLFAPYCWTVGALVLLSKLI
jgi:undecaprenyl-diphosphatase